MEPVHERATPNRKFNFMFFQFIRELEGVISEKREMKRL